MSVVKVDIGGEKHIKIRAIKELILLRDILPKVMSDIRLRIIAQKIVTSRTIADSRGARGQGRSGKVRSPGTSPATALETGKPRATKKWTTKKDDT